MKPDFTLEFIKDDNALSRLAETLLSSSAFAVDIETVEWWNRSRERIALVQFAFRQGNKSKAAIVDALAALDFNLLRKPLEETSIVKIIHNAAFDAPRLVRQYRINTAPVHDTMLAARRSGERKYSLKAQAAIHLGINLDKTAQRSDWSKRPLDMRQLSYAAIDAHATLLLYEHQVTRNLKYEYFPKNASSANQFSLPLGGVESGVESGFEKAKIESSAQSDPVEASVLETELNKLTESLLGITTELPTRYSPDSLAASLEGVRTGLAGWIIDRRLGPDAELDQETVKLAIADLCERKLLQITATRRLEATGTGIRLWQKLKN